MSDNPILSIALITYNQEEFIGDCLEGMVHQECTYPFEIVIGEDCSTDKTREICLKYKEKYPQLIRLAFPEKNLGMMGNWIHTITSCTGKYVAICEGDDYWIDKHKLQKQIDFLEKHPNFSLCSTAAQRFYYGRFWDAPISKEVLTTADLLIEDWGIMTATIVFRRSMLEIPEWFKNVKNGDYSLQLLLSLKGNVGCLTDVTSVYRQHPGGVSNSLTAYRQASWLIYLLWEFNKQTQGKYYSLIKTKISRVYQNQMRFAKENQLRKAFWKLNFFRMLSPLFPFMIKNFRK